MAPLTFLFPIALAVLAFVFYPSAYHPTSTTSCLILPTDASWPSMADWDNLNATVGGRLIATTPLAAVCHDPNFDAAKCNAIKKNWLQPWTHEESAHSIMAPFYQNRSCDPFTPRSRPCELGNFVSYSINASSAEDISAGIKFAKMKNIRLVVKNTGHDFLGRSTGTGGLGIWTHNLRTSRVIPIYRSSSYNGTAIMLGAGIRGFEALDIAHKNGLQVVTGFCPTVGVAGGFLQGGGSGPLSSIHGMAADQALEYEVVTAAGETIVANPTHNVDLYWALSGGGGGTYAVVISVTVRAFRDGVIGGASLSFLREGVGIDTVYDMFGHLLDLTPSLIDAGIQFGWLVTRQAFVLEPLTAPGFTEEHIRLALKPFTAKLDQGRIDYQLKTTSLPSYKSHFEHYLGPFPAGRYLADSMVGSRLIPRHSLTGSRTALVQATRMITENSSAFVVYIAANNTMSGTKQPIADNSVLPQWRKAAVHAMATLEWDFCLPRDDMMARQAELQKFVVPQLRRALPPDAGTYINEAEVGNENWKKDYFGDNYERLLQIKRVYDPTDLFYVEYGVGSDAWYRAPDGRLCRT
ncbi:FAD-linked oxidoreductase ZEB1 [Fusarium oxysporum f. sp. cubense]|uniref:FAD-linked oxidoreductase ZEB1 n=1 Tax=Fusarium oxysporum f. sp. cubense TaxID=61366 RepID=A0A559L7Z6_FUSOC|nr:FAD-linked oxidoreductase ZEB1 [Fusarium oxysporum f. sp. cubense]